MINFHASTFTWKAHAREPHPYYRWDGGFVGKVGEVLHVRFSLEAACTVTDEATGHISEMFLGAPCRAEYTIAKRNLFQVPSNDFRMAFSRDRSLTLANRPSNEPEESRAKLLNESYNDHRIDIRHYGEPSEVTNPAGIIDATLANDLVNARSTYRDTDRGLSVSVEYPVNLINVNPTDGEYQVCTGPVILPDLETWDGQSVTRVFLAHVAFTASNYVEFILRREIDASDSEKTWLAQPRGLDRNELLYPGNQPPGYPPRRWQATAYAEVWELEASNVVLRAENP